MNVEPEWTFYEWRTGPRQRDPIQGEFFATEAIRDPSEAMVREGTQNTLDAAASVDGVAQTRVRITLSTGSRAAVSAEVAPFFRGVWPHLSARGNGLRPDSIPAQGESCPFLLFEDFGTTGLVGDEKQINDTGEPNPFYFFFRAENRSAKSGESRGRWGVGKQVFPRASRANLIFGYTVRRDDGRRMLMGSAVLKSHHVAGDTAFYMADGFFGHRREDGLVLPVIDDLTLDRFGRAFGITRGTNEAGTSIVVPWLSDEISLEAVLDAAISGYFWPILNQQLTVEVCSETTAIVIDHERLPELAARMRPEIRALVALAAWAADVKPKNEISLAIPAQEKPVWNDSSIAPETLAVIRQCLLNENRVIVKIPLWVRRRKPGDRWAESCFRVFLEEARDSQSRPTFARDGIIVTAAALPSPLVGMRALVVIDHSQLANMFGDAETPAHTQWQPGYLKGRYFYGAETIKFVRSAAHELVARLRAQDTESDKIWLASFFPIPGDDDKASSVSQKKTGTESPIEKIAPPKRPAPPYAIERVKGGFAVLSGLSVPPIPILLEVQAAYAVREGNPLSEWAPEDFQMVYPPLRIDPKPVGLKVLEQSGKRLLLEVQSSPFRIDVVGFDTRRDLYVKVDVRHTDDPAN